MGKSPKKLHDPNEMEDRDAGSYDYWKKNYQSNPEYQRILDVLKGYGHDVSKTEIDHFPPKSIYPDLGANNINEGKMTAIPLIKGLHQPTKGKSYSGGYATSSKSNKINKGYRELLGEKRKLSSEKDFYNPFDKNNDPLPKARKFYRAIRRDLIDKQNLVPEDRHLFDRLLKPGVDRAQKQGLISEQEQMSLYSHLDLD